MKKRFNEEQIIPILREADVTGHNLDGCRTSGIPEQTFSHWRRRYQGLSGSALHRLKLLASEHTQLKRLVAEHALALQHLQELLKKKGCCERAPCAGAGTDGPGPLRAPGL